MTNFESLKQLEIPSQKLENTGEKLLQIIQNCVAKGLLVNSFTEEAEKALKKLRQDRFRIAVIGEFSQGKSTLLNALLGEEIQPVRMSPCSVTVTVLRYGSKKKVTCHYKNGKSEEIPLEKYHEKAAMSEEIAEGANYQQEPANSQIKEIVFEHPDLELCRNGVEIVDSPGLNENRDRTAITRQIIKDTDAIIFLTNASRLLTEGERELLEELRLEINNGNANKPAENIFVLVNFMDLVRREKDRQSLQKRATNLLQGEKPIISGENRIHFISAQAALDAILERYEDDCLAKFRDFTQSLEQFLLNEKGSLKIKQSCDRFDDLIRSSLGYLEKNLEDSQSKKEEILEQIGTLSGINTRISNFAQELYEETRSLAIDSFNNWLDELHIAMINRSSQWQSEHHFWNKEKLIQDYCYQFQHNLRSEIHRWSKYQLQKQILIPQIEILDRFIPNEIENLEQNSQSLNSSFELNNYSNLVITKIDNNNDTVFSWINSLPVTFGVELLSLSLFPSFIESGLIETVLGLFSGESEEEKQYKIKMEVIDKGLAKFYEPADQINTQLEENIVLAFKAKVEATEKAIQHIMNDYDRALEEIEEKEKQEQKQINYCIQEIETMQKQIKKISIQMAN